jgi:hemoglobin
MSEPALPSTLSEALVTDLVHLFYARIREDEVLGPLFEERLEGRWDEHLARMVEFWESVVLLTGRYRGRPHEKHRGMPLDPQHFWRWLALFEKTTRELCTGHAAETFMSRAHRIAESLQIGLNIGPKALHFAKAPVSTAQPH